MSEIRANTVEAAKAVRAAWQRRVLLVFAAPTLACIVGFVATRPQVQGLGLVVLVCGVLLMLLVLVLALRARDGEVDGLVRELEVLDEEVAALAKARELARSRQPFAVFLRSFDAEAGGYLDKWAGNDAVDKSFVGYQLAAGEEKAHWHMPPDRDWVTDTNWDHQIAILEVLRQRTVPILLTNLRLGGGADGLSRNKGVLSIPIVAGDWWSAVLEFTALASVTVVFADRPTAMLLREIRHLSGAGDTPYVAFVSPATEAVLAAEQSAGVPVLENARAVIRGDAYQRRDTGPLAKVLDTLLGADASRDDGVSATPRIIKALQ